MKTKVEKLVKVEVEVCNICGKEITSTIHNRERIRIVAGLFKTTDFDAHEVCINKILKETFVKYLPINTKE